MNRNNAFEATEVEVWSCREGNLAEMPVPIAVVVAPPTSGQFPAWAAGLLCVLMLALVSGCGAWMWSQREANRELRREAEAILAQSAATSAMATGTFAALQQSIADNEAQMAAWERMRQELQETGVASAEATQPAARTAATVAPAGDVVPLAEGPTEADAPAKPAIETVPQEVPDPQLQAAISATQALVSTNAEEPPSLEEIRTRIKAEDPRVATNKDARDEKSPLMKALTHPILVDSAVLTASLFVPPSLPLTLAQSRLGRSLTKRAMKEADLNKTVAAQVATDVGNMPITMKKKKKK